MCGIAGFIAFDRNNQEERWQEIGLEMADRLAHRGPNDRGVWAGQFGVLSHCRLAVIDPEGGRQPMTRNQQGGDYTIVYNGELYNTDALRQQLQAKGYQFQTTSDTEVLLTAYMAYGEAVSGYLEGIYAFVIWDGLKQQFFACRDRFGVKPFFYGWGEDGALVFGSELKALFCYPHLTPTMDDVGWCQLLGLGPARSPGSGVFAGIYALEPAHQMVISPEGVDISCYWKLESRPHTDSYQDTVAHTRELVTGAIRRQLVSDVPLCTFLSGGLDSSIITAVAALDYQERGLPALETYSFDYTDNEKFFKSSAFQPDADWPWVQRMQEHFGTRHQVLTCPIPELVDCLSQATQAKDLPGMADVDASLLYFCRQVAEHHVVALSGECADELFGGYPWFQREDLLTAPTFPWSADTRAREQVFLPSLWKRLDVEDYVRHQYQQSVDSTPYLEGETGLDRRRREVAWLNLGWFMATLLARKDRMSMASSLEVRVPYCDHHLMEYVWNVPWEMKAKGGNRKQLLRDAAQGLLPEDVRNRPKSPYPKTHNPLYEQLMGENLRQILADSNAPIHSLVDKKTLEQGLLTSAGDYGRPWFGQLMAGPQMLAYLVQLNQWMEAWGLVN